MIVTYVEGIPGMGKSTTLRAITEEKVIDELGHLIPEHEFPGNGTSLEEILSINKWFIKQEQKRFSGEGIYDRSFFGDWAYSFAYSRFTNISSFKETLSLYQKAVENKTLVLPDTLIYITGPVDISIKRQETRVKNGEEHALPGFWMEKSFLEDLKTAYKHILKNLVGSKKIVLSATDSFEINKEKILSGIQKKKEKYFDFPRFNEVMSCYFK